MADLKLPKLRDRTPITLKIAVPADLHEKLQQYQRLYTDAYGEAQPVTELIPAMLEVFLDSDRALSGRRSRGKSS